ncbi:ribosomal-protein-alanine acetyltransferase [Thermosinus carboxydivorans Nor1]|uniref:[Ribosomal protein bS18]-alanine N-acetyltransferase n=1 Tax=Thermosinus carboxydivorans Nor1 TaxID=401526 RepID=A1HSU4_9FIRM|nr:ribosomal protein S18-alanine N-acetyltransferase [Thermosinus carboxydivorans]EAX46888.1 ribosomal-protein-alanine acetyltransferase [Thermosinus carboxydivorans Nor1]
MSRRKWVIRPMTADDIDAVLEVERASFTTPWSRAAFAAEVADNDLAYYLVGEADGAVVGYAGVWIILDEAHVTNIAVLPAYRGQGLGEQLLTALMAYAKKRGALSMTLEVRVSNEGAQRLYRRLGFMPRGIRKQYYSDTKEDALIMWKEGL